MQDDWDPTLQKSKAYEQLLVDIINYRRDRTPFRNGVMITPLFDSEGQLAWFLGSQVDLGSDPAVHLAGRRGPMPRRASRHFPPASAPYWN